MVSPIVANAEPSAMFTVRWSWLSLAACNAASASGDNTRIATRNPPSATGKPARSIP